MDAIMPRRPRSSIASGRARASKFAGRGWIVAFTAFLILLFLGGGGARGDIMSLPFVRFAAVIVIGSALLWAPAAQFREMRSRLLWIGLAAALVLVQLIPLPFGIWAALPGHDRYAVLAQLGVATSWRPVSLTPDLTLNSLLALVSPAAIICGAVMCATHHRMRVLDVIIAIALFSALLGMAQLASGDGSPLRFYAVTNDSSAVGLFANRNHQALFLSTAIVLVAARASMPLQNTDLLRWRALFGGVAGAFLLTMVMMTGSRAGAVLGIVASAAAVFVYRRSSSSSRRSDRRIGWPIIAAVSGVALIVVALAILLLLKSSTLGRLMETDIAEEERLTVLPQLSRIAWDFFPFGTGFGAFDTVFRAYEPFAFLKVTYLNQAHNDLLQLVIESGIGGIALLAIYLVWWVRAAWAILQGSGREDEDRLARTGMVVTALLLAASVTDYPLRTPSLAGLMALASFWMMRPRSGDAPLPDRGARVEPR